MDSSFDEDLGIVMKSSINLPQQQQKQPQDSAKNQLQNGKIVLNGWQKGEKSWIKRHKQQSYQAVSRFEEAYCLTGKTLGRGAYAPVESCVNRRDLQEYAVKIIDKQPNHSRLRIIKEIELFNLCAGHPNIVQLIEYFEEDDKFYLIFEIMRGGPLLSHIQRRICFTENEAGLVVRDIANALKFLHDRGIAHRDLKPENILCTNPDTVSPVKLCDLDLASKTNLHSLHAISTPELQSPVGSAEFMAPEVVDAFVGESLRYDKRCDLWSLGVILYIMLCGYPPFYGECDRDECGWNEGLPCADCQETLFAKIQLGRFDFPDRDWSYISDEAKSLITHLLERDVNRRYGVDDVLSHPFVVNEAPKTPLQTPNMLLRNDSKRDLAENFNAVDRIKWQPLSSNDTTPGGALVANGGVTTPTNAINIPIAAVMATAAPPAAINTVEATVVTPNVQNQPIKFNLSSVVLKKGGNNHNHQYNHKKSSQLEVPENSAAPNSTFILHQIPHHRKSRSTFLGVGGPANQNSALSSLANQNSTLANQNLSLANQNSSFSSKNSFSTNQNSRSSSSCGRNHLQRTVAPQAACQALNGFMGNLIIGHHHGQSRNASNDGVSVKV